MVCPLLTVTRSGPPARLEGHVAADGLPAEPHAGEAMDGASWRTISSYRPSSAGTSSSFSMSSETSIAGSDAVRSPPLR